MAIGIRDGKSIYLQQDTQRDELASLSGNNTKRHDIHGMHGMHGLHGIYERHGVTC